MGKIDTKPIQPYTPGQDGHRVITCEKLDNKHELTYYENLKEETKDFILQNLRDRKRNCDGCRKTNITSGWTCLKTEEHNSNTRDYCEECVNTQGCGKVDRQATAAKQHIDRIREAAKSGFRRKKSKRKSTKRSTRKKPTLKRRIRRTSKRKTSKRKRSTRRTSKRKTSKRKRVAKKKRSTRRTSKRKNSKRKRSAKKNRANA